MAKKPSTSSLDRSDVADFVVDDRSPEETKAIYNNWASNYEEDMALQKYKAPNIMAHFINQELQVKKDAVIIDVGCGTGLLGVELKNLGYSYIDGLDYSDGMMAEAIKKNIYRRRFIERVSKSGKLPLKDGEYDVVALCGCLMPGHIMPDALPEVARLLKPNGRLMWIHRTLDHYESKSEQFLETRFTGTLQSLCRQFRMEIVVRKKVQDYRLKCDGQIFALKKK
ncbi:methyltransferase-like protein 27 [Amblyomma americanum]